MKINKVIIFSVIYVLAFVASYSVGVDQIIRYDEKMVGSGHPTLADTLNRALLIEHNADGTHQVYHATLNTLFNPGGSKIFYTDNNGVLHTVTIGTSGTVFTSSGPGSAPTWSAAGAGTPGGSDTQFQYNDNGVFNGSVGMTYAKATKVVTFDNSPVMPGITSSATDNTRFFGKANTGDLDVAYRAAGRHFYNTTEDVSKVCNGDNTALYTIPMIVGVPDNAASACKVGWISYDASYIYICISSDTWKRVGVSTWP